jgi:seryl-tRNA(Sec) selenium transferase
MSRDALVVGINTYVNLSALSAPAQDAEAVAQRLEQDGDFQVKRLPEVIQGNDLKVGETTQVTLRDLRQALVQLFKPDGTQIPNTVH